MTCNVGGAERKIRIVAGALILVAGALWQSWWGLVGLVPLATGFFRFCPLWTLFGINTDKPKGSG